ncbi:MAG: DUF305 domain-containing protein [Acidimicrobiales bacterium]
MTDDQLIPARYPLRTATRARAIRLGLVSLVVAVAATACGEGDREASGVTEAHNDADVAFVSAMVPHHRQAIEMVSLVAAKGESTEVKSLAEDIRSAQETEIGMMTQWADAWEVSDQIGSGSGGGMEGMMTPAQMSEMEQAMGPQLDRMFLENMIRHHEGAIVMANRQAENGRFDPARDLARKIVVDQESEIERMKELLANSPVLG